MGTNIEISNDDQGIEDTRIRILVLGEYKTGKSTLVDILINRDKEAIPWEDQRNSMNQFRFSIVISYFNIFYLFQH